MFTGSIVVGENHMDFDPPLDIVMSCSLYHINYDSIPHITQIMKHSEVDYGLSLTNCVIIKQKVAKFQSFYSKLTLPIANYDC